MTNLTDLRNETVEDLNAECECAGCGNLYKMSELAPIRDFALRASPGEETPAGECPSEDCGAFCFLTEYFTRADFNTSAKETGQTAAARAMLAALEAAMPEVAPFWPNGPTEINHRLVSAMEAAIAQALAAGITPTV